MKRTHMTARFLALVVVVGSLGAGPQSLAQSNSNECSVDADCDDGNRCNGEEVCILIGDPGAYAYLACRSGPAPSCDDGISCTRDRCWEQSCFHDPPDVDGDGHGDAACVDRDGEPLGDDCDDRNATRYPGNVERCDAIDQDCDPRTLASPGRDGDADGDGYLSSSCCNGSLCGNDCDDSRTDVGPFLPDVCDDLDNDCSGVVDDGETCQPCGGRLTLYPDLDRDGFGDPNGAMSGCANDPRYSTLPGDCDDRNPSIVPGAQVCGGVNSVRVCSSTGTWTARSCLGAFERCAAQADGTGVCFR